MEKKVFDEEIDLVWIFYSLIKKIWLIVIVAAVTACGMAGYTYFRTEPTYTSTSTMLVLTKETTLTSLADLQIGSQLTKDCFDYKSSCVGRSYRRTGFKNEL